MKITNNTDRDISILGKTLESFIPYAQERLEYDKPFQIIFETDEENAKNIFGKTAYYDPATMNVHVYTDGRHDKDVLRSISHEMVHHAQNCRGDFEGAFEMGEGYAQKSPHLRNMEAEAYLLGNGFLVRDFEDHVKLGDTVLQEWNNEKKNLLTEASFSIFEAWVNKLVKKAPVEIGHIQRIAESYSETPTLLAKAEALILSGILKVTPKEFMKTMAPTKSLMMKKEKEDERESSRQAKTTTTATKKTGADPQGKNIAEEKNVKEHYKIKNEKMYEEFMKRFIKKGDK